MVADGRAARVGRRARRRPLRHAAAAGRAGAGRGPPGDAGDRPPGRPPGARDDAGGAVRLPGAAVVGGAGPPAGRAGHRDRGRTRAPAGDGARGAGRRGGVRRDHRQPRSSRCGRGVGSLDGAPGPSADRGPATSATADHRRPRPSEAHACLPPTSTPRVSPTPRSTTCSPRPTASTSWSSTAPSAPGRSTPTTPSSARACWSTSARWSTPTSRRSRSRSRCARSTTTC